MPTPTAPDRPRPIFRSLQVLLRLMVRSTTRAHVEGTANYPASGPYIIAINHLHLLDIPVIFTTMQHQTAGIAAQQWAEHWLVGRFLGQVTKVIPVNPERVDHRAITESLAWIERGGVLLVAPEGQRSPTGALSPGQPGLALLASRTGVPVLPVVAWGQEHLPRHWSRLRRPPIGIRVGEPIAFPGSPTRARSPELDAFTEHVMQTLAVLLPPEYRGVYAHAAQ